MKFIKNIFYYLLDQEPPVAKTEFEPCINGNATADIEAISANIDAILTNMLFSISKNKSRAATRDDACSILAEIANDLKNNTRTSVLTQDIINFFESASKSELKHPYV